MIRPITCLLSPLRLHQSRRDGRHRGQSMLLVALMFTVLIGVVGLAVDGAVAYAYSIAVERGASSAALAGAPYMPNQFQSPPAPAGANATDRALAEAARNGYKTGVNGAQVVIPPQTGSTVFQVTINQDVPTFFMHALGFPKITVSRTAVAGYRPPIKLGQPGNQVGSTVTQLGDPNQFYFPRLKGYANSPGRSEGDAYTPNPAEPGGSTSKDVHNFSDQQGTESPDVSCSSGAAVYPLPCRGGYNYRISVPDGAVVQVYNAANAPEEGAKANWCDNWKNPRTGHCNTNSTGFNLHEQDNGSKCDPSDVGGATCNQNAFSAFAYTVLKVNDAFLRTTDTAMSQTKVFPIEATNWDGAHGATGTSVDPVANPPVYWNVKDANTVKQFYNADGSPCNMQIYHAWINVLSYNGTGCGAGNDDGLVTHSGGGNSGGGTALSAGTYRMRVDQLSYNGNIDQSSEASHGYSVRVLNADGTPCNGCVAGWDDMCVYSPIPSSTGGGTIPLFALPKDYAGTTLDIDIFDVGDGGGSGSVDLAIIDPTGGGTASPYTAAVAQTAGGAEMVLTAQGVSRYANGSAAFPYVTHVPPQAPAPVSPAGTQLTAAQHGPTYGLDQAGEGATKSGTIQWQGTWIRFTIPIPDTYNPDNVPVGVTPDEYWRLSYKLTGTITMNDTFTFAVAARGGPVHLISS